MLYLVGRIEKAQIRLSHLLGMVLSAETAVLVIAATVRQVVIRYPADSAAEALSLLPWVVLAWMDSDRVPRSIGAYPRRSAVVILVAARLRYL